MIEYFRSNYFSIWSSDMPVTQLEKEISLSQVELLYYNRITSERRRKEWLISRIVVRRELGNEVSTAYEGRKPYLVGSDRYLSISHSDHLVAVMIGEESCGIDLENSTRNFDRVSSRFLNPPELERIPKEQICIAWGIKEAAYKRIGVLDIDFATMFEIRELGQHSAILHYDGNDYFFRIVSLGKYNVVFSVNETEFSQNSIKF